MYSITKHARSFLEIQAFGVCSFLGKLLGIPSTQIRMFFIYASCLTLFSPVLIYLAIAFVLNLKKYVRRQKYSVWEL